MSGRAARRAGGQDRRAAWPTLPVHRTRRRTDQPQRQGDHPRGRLRGAHLRAGHRRPRHRPGSRVPELVPSRPTSGVGAPVVQYLPEDSVLVIGYIEGRTFTDDGLRPGPGPSNGWRRPAGGSTRGERFVNDFDMFEIQRGYLDLVLDPGLPAARRTISTSARGRAHPGRPRRAGRAHGGLQQRPAGRQLHRRRRPDPAHRLRVLRATTTPASSSGTSGASAIWTTTSWTTWSPRTTGRRLAASWPAPVCSA